MVTYKLLKIELKNKLRIADNDIKSKINFLS